MEIAISTCPNDTYLFYGWINGLVGQEIVAEPIFADIQQLNEWTIEAAFPLIKLSFSIFEKAAVAYQLLPIGSALGFNCGPKIVAKEPFSLSELPEKKIAVPGHLTTAHLLLNRLPHQPKKRIFCLYHEVVNSIRNGMVDCGLIIHETRFTFQEMGFFEIADLGKIWHEETNLPLPLGGLAIKRTLPQNLKVKVLSILKESLAFARNAPKETLLFILSKAQEKKEEIIWKHIETYVNRETEFLTSRGIKAIETLLHCNLPHDWLFLS